MYFGICMSSVVNSTSLFVFLLFFYILLYVKFISSRSQSLRLFQVRKEMLLDPVELQQFQNHSSQMAALDFMVSIASNTFIPTYDGNMAKVVEGHRRCVSHSQSM